MSSLTICWSWGIEVSGGFEGEGDGVFGSAFVGVEEEAVGGD